MWHEARRQEKAVRQTMIDISKRNERRKKFYENIRKDPEQFMQIHGRSCTIHTDKAIARAAEEVNVLRPWQGDPTIKIDRFDARSHLDFIPAPKKDKPKIDSSEEKMEILLDFERYRILIINDYRQVAEKDFLKKIREKEFWNMQSTGRFDREAKKKLAETKASIGFSYDDGDVVKGSNTASDSESEDEIEETEDNDLDINTLSAESCRTADKIGEAYGIRRGCFSQIQRADHQQMLDNSELKQIEREKAALAGRAAKGERAKLKHRRALIVGRGCTEESVASLLSFITAGDSKKKDDDSSSSSSDEDALGKTVFIQSIDDSGKMQEDDEEETEQIQGPELPNEEARRIYQLKARADTPPIQFPSGSRRERSRERSRDRSRDRSRGRSRDRSRERRRSRTRSRDRRDRDRRSRDRDRERYRRRSYSRDSRGRRSRTRSRDRERRRSRSRDRRDKRDEYSRRRRVSKSPARYSSSSRSPSPKKKRERTPPESGNDYESDGSLSMLEIRSSMSEEEKEKREIENRKRRIKRTKKMVKGRERRNSSDDEERASQHAKKIRQKMQNALKKSVGELKAEEKEKQRELERERQQRNMALYEEDVLRRERERRARRDERDRRGDR